MLKDHVDDMWRGLLMSYTTTINRRKHKSEKKLACIYRNQKLLNTLLCCVYALVEMKSRWSANINHHAEELGVKLNDWVHRLFVFVDTGTRGEYPLLLSHQAIHCKPQMLQPQKPSPLPYSASCLLSE